MKAFIVNFKNNYNLQPYEPFYFEGMKNGNIAVYENTLNRFEELADIRKWLSAEINRNPFQIKEGVVVLLFPRDLTGNLSPQDYDVYIRIYVHEMLKKHFDSRFKYVCFFIDKCDNNLKDSRIYKELDESHHFFACGDSSLNNTVFLNSAIIEERTVENFNKAIENLEDDTVKTFYHGIVDDMEIDPKSDSKTASETLSAFPHKCREKLECVSYYNVPYSSIDVSQNIHINFKLNEVIRKIAEGNSPLPRFSDERVSANNGFFADYRIDLEKIKALLSTYQLRLRNCIAESKSLVKNQEELLKEEMFTEDFTSLPEYSELKRYVDSISVNLNISTGDLEKTEASQLIFENVKQHVDEADRNLSAFADAVVERAKAWRSSHKEFTLNRPETNRLNSDEQQEEREATEMLNQYKLLEQIGFSEQSRIIQELEGQDVILQRIAAKLKTYTRAAFFGSLLFSLLVIAVLYFGVQVSVFVKENTWWVFGAYIGITVLTFLPAYFIIKKRYLKDFSNSLSLCTVHMDRYFANYVDRADEFAHNIQAAMAYLCKYSHLSEISQMREDDALRQAQLNWHIAKMESLLKDLGYFDAFIGNTEPLRETSVPQIDVTHDAVHNEFYQMKLFF